MRLSIALLLLVLVSCCYSRSKSKSGSGSGSGSSGSGSGGSGGGSGEKCVCACGSACSKLAGADGASGEGEGEADDPSDDSGSDGEDEEPEEPTTMDMWLGVGECLDGDSACETKCKNWPTDFGYYQMSECAPRTKFFWSTKNRCHCVFSKDEPGEEDDYGDEEYNSEDEDYSDEDEDFDNEDEDYEDEDYSEDEEDGSKRRRAKRSSSEVTITTEERDGLTVWVLTPNEELPLCDDCDCSCACGEGEEDGAQDDQSDCFESVYGYVLSADIETEEYTESFDDCKNLCLDDDDCLSGLYYPTESEFNCRLMAESATTSPDLYEKEEEGVHMVYFEKQEGC